MERLGHGGVLPSFITAALKNPAHALQSKEKDKERPLHCGQQTRTRYYSYVPEASLSVPPLFHRQNHGHELKMVVCHAVLFLFSLQVLRRWTGGLQYRRAMHRSES